MLRDARRDSDLLDRRNLFLLRTLDRVGDRIRVCLRYLPKLAHPLRIFNRFGVAPLRRLFNP
jgi:hypothetical protein